MSSSDADQLTGRLRQWVRSHREDVQLALSRPEIEHVLDELHRLHQSNERLRKQNKKLRGRIRALRAGEEDPGEDDAVGEPGGRPC